MCLTLKVGLQFVTQAPTIDCCLHELHCSALQDAIASRAKTAFRRKVRDDWVDQLEMSNNVLAMDSLCFREWARLMEGKSDHHLEDAMTAATARMYNCNAQWK